MKKGGAREGAGRKSPWSTSETKPVRVPEYLADEVLAFARRLDRERTLAAKQDRLADLLEEFLQLPQENRQKWVEKLPEEYRDLMQNADYRRGLFKAQTIKLETFPEDEDPISLSVTWRVRDFGSFRVVELSNGQVIRLESRNGRLECPTMGVPQEGISLFVDDDKGKVYLRIHSDWNIDHLVKAESISSEEGVLERWHSEEI